jgi:hypothetical protein
MIVIASEVKQSNPEIEGENWLASSWRLSSGRPLLAGPVGSSQ